MDSLMLGLGLASSHAPGMFRPKEDWPRLLNGLPPEIKDSLPHSAKVELVSPAIIEDHIRRIEVAFATLRAEIEAYRPDALGLPLQQP